MGTFEIARWWGRGDATMGGGKGRARRAGPGGVSGVSRTHLTTKALSLSICRRETSRRAVEGTPSSSICGATKGGRKMSIAVRAREEKITRGGGSRIRAASRDASRYRWFAHLEARLLQRHQTTRRPLPGLVHLPVRALPNLLELLIRLVDGVAHLCGVRCRSSVNCRRVTNATLQHTRTALRRSTLVTGALHPR